MTINYGLNRVRFPAPVVADSKSGARVTLQSVKDIPDGIEAAYAIVVEGEKAEKLLRGRVGAALLPLECLSTILV